jgi:hypothetical protein
MEAWWVAQSTHVAVIRTHVARSGLFLVVVAAKIRAKIALPARAR